MARVVDIAKRRGAADPPAEPSRLEDIEARVAETAQLFVDASFEPRDNDLDEADAGERASARDHVYSALKGFIADELTIVSPLEGADGIDPDEQKRQLARRALSQLTKPDLQRAAAHAGLAQRGTKEQLIDRFLLHFGADAQQIASVVNSADRRTSEGRRHSTRLFVYEDLNGTEALGERLAPFAGRYVRTGLANWFVVRRVVADSQAMELAGEVRSYDVSLEDPDLRGSRHDAPVDLLVHDRQSVLRARTRAENAAIASVEAFSYLAGQLPLPPLGRVARSGVSWGNVGGLALQTTWLLGVLLGLLENDRCSLREVTSVSFERPARDRVEFSAAEPRVRSASLRGQHVLDSQSACRHVNSGERLRAVSALVAFKADSQGSSVTLPVRLAVEQSYVAVMCGFGGVSREESRAQHAVLEDLIAEQVVQPSVDGAELERVITAMLDRATATDPPKEADLFARLQDAEIVIDRAAGSSHV